MLSAHDKSRTTVDAFYDEQIFAVFEVVGKIEREAGVAAGVSAEKFAVKPDFGFVIRALEVDKQPFVSFFFGGKRARIPHCFVAVVDVYSA